MELAKWTFPIIVSFSREPYEVESLTYGSNGGHGETYRQATRPVPTQYGVYSAIRTPFRSPGNILRGPHKKAFSRRYRDESSHGLPVRSLAASPGKRTWPDRRLRIPQERRWYKKPLGNNHSMDNYHP